MIGFQDVIAFRRRRQKLEQGGTPYATNRGWKWRSGAGFETWQLLSQK